MREYYDQRAPEYDDWWTGTGLFATRDRPGWHDEVQALIDTLGALPARRTLDIACGTAFLSRHLPGDVTGLDASPAMVGIAATRLPRVVEGDALHPPFPEGAFERVAASHFYGHLEDPERAGFLATAARLAPELLIVDSARREDVPAARMDPRVLNDGSRHAVFKRWFEPDELAEEIGGRVVHAGRWFVAVMS
jgi:SAM-dependent methyltransferase